MRPFTTGRLLWNGGVSFATLSKGMMDFFQKTDLKFDRHHIYHGDGIFMILREGKTLEFSDEPWRDDPILKPGFRRASWSFWEADGSHWMNFACNGEDQPGATRENLPTKVFVLGFSFDGLLYTRSTMTVAQFDAALKKYHLLKNLFHAVGCDELTGVDANAADPLNPRYSDPAYGGWCFRFSRVGKQVLIRAMEERRMPPANTDPDFVFVDPN